MKNYEYVGNTQYLTPVIFINTLDDVYYLYSDIYNEFSIKYGKNFEIIIDLFLRNGFSFNRFVKIIFTNEDVRSEIINPLSIDEEIKSKIRMYLKDNLDLLEQSTISNSVKDFIIKSK